MLRVHLLTGLAWTAPIVLDCDIRGDLMKAIDDYYHEHGKDGFPVRLYELHELDGEDVNDYIPINGGQYWIQGISHVEVLEKEAAADTEAIVPIDVEDYKADGFAEFSELAAGCISPDIVQLLLIMGYFTAPASHRYHGAIPGGLCKHSIAVARALVKLTEDLHLVWSRPESPILVGLLHDLCKMDYYIENAEWKEDLPAAAAIERYSYNDKQEIKGHGDKSVVLAQILGIRLTKEEELCIRWHMGAYEGKQAWENLDAAMRKFHNILWTHTADMMASKFEEI